MKWRALDLFSGIGGWSLAAHRKGIETVAACEIDDWKWKQYHQHFPHVHRYRDVREITRSRLEADGRLPIDVIVGSPPCTDISAANHAGLGVDGEESKLYFEAIRIVAEVRPLWVAFENSDNLRSRGADRVLAALEAEGYACFPCVVGAVHAGAPHRRNRSWLVATNTDRSGLREQSGWSGRTNGKGAPVSAPDDRQRTADANGIKRRAGRWQGHANWNEFARRGEATPDDAHANSEGKHGIAKHAEVVGWSGDAGCAEPDRTSGGVTMPTPTARDWKSGKCSDDMMRKNSRPLNEALVSTGMTDPVLLLVVYESMMGFPPGWLAQPALDAARSSPSSTKPEALTETA